MSERVSMHHRVCRWGNSSDVMVLCVNMCRPPSSGGGGNATGPNAKLANIFTELAAHYKGDP